MPNNKSSDKYKVTEKQEIIGDKEGEFHIEPLSTKESDGFLKSFSDSANNFIEPFFRSSSTPTLASVTSQFLANSLYRQALGNIKFDVNNQRSFGETIKEMVKSPSQLINGVQYRFALQMMTQGIPTMRNRIPDAEISPQLSQNLTILLMTTLGAYFEARGQKGSVESLIGKEVDFNQKLPAMSVCLFPVLLSRNIAYTKAVFGQSTENPLYERVGIAALVGAATTPLDNAVNKTIHAGLKNEDQNLSLKALSNIYKDVTESFGKNDFKRILNESFKGVGLRVGAIAGASTILSPESTKFLVENVFGKIKQNPNEETPSTKPKPLSVKETKDKDNSSQRTS